jgi:hypothetical protein
MNKGSPSQNLTRSIPKHEKAAVTAESNGLRCLGGEGLPPCLSQARTLPTQRRKVSDQSSAAEIRP